MRKTLFCIVLLCVLPGWGQQLDSLERERQKRLSYIPKLQVGFDLISLLENYVSIVPFVEYQINQDMAIMQELGPVLVPESYNGEEFDQYFGLEGRTEFKLYYGEKPYKKARSWVGLDAGFQLDWYEDRVWINEGNFERQVDAKIRRSVFSTHLRIGTERVLSTERVLISGSFGLGRSFYDVSSEQGDLNFVSRDFWISRESVMDPFSVNLRLKFGFILKKLIEVQDK